MPILHPKLAFAIASMKKTSINLSNMQENEYNFLQDFLIEYIPKALYCSQKIDKSLKYHYQINNLSRKYEKNLKNVFDVDMLIDGNENILQILSKAMYKINKKQKPSLSSSESTISTPLILSESLLNQAAESKKKENNRFLKVQLNSLNFYLYTIVNFAEFAFYVPMTNLYIPNPCAVLSINTDIQWGENSIFFVKLISSILSILGYQLVLVSRSSSQTNFADGVSDTTDILEFGNFIESHFFVECISNSKNRIFLQNLNKVSLQQCIYSYVHTEFNFFIRYSSKHTQNNPYIQVVQYSILSDKTFDIDFKTDTVEELTQLKYKFPDSLGVFRYPLSIFLCNVPLYLKSDRKDIVPYCISNILEVKVNSKRFVIWDGRRVLVDITHDNNSLYVEFEDLHLLKPELFVINPLYLIETEKNILEKVDEIYSNIINSDNKYLKEMMTIFANQEKNISNLVGKTAFLLYDYSLHSSTFKKKIILHRNQIFATIKACISCLMDKKSTKSNGIIYQVDTGEGKSFIIRVIAIILSQLGKSVHIATSNIKLACRDYLDGYSFFNHAKAKTAVLLHEKELSTLQHLAVKESNIDELAYSDPDLYDHELFNNPSSLNIQVFSKAKILFSTFLNLEGLYLRLMEDDPREVKKIFNNSVLIIDEADNILIDELSNGTILSKPMKSNSVEILKYVYDSQDGPNKAEPNEVLEYIHNNFPECTDITIDHVNELINEVELVKSDEYREGKKYIIQERNVMENEDIEEEDIDEEKKGKEKSKMDGKEEKNGKKSRKEEKKKKKSIRFSKSKKTKFYEDDDEKPEIIEKVNEKEIEKRKKKKKVKEIIPFDWENKGIAEPNKEFSGFVHQLIAIKERKQNPEKNQNLLIRPMSMNYLYISHPIFVKNYGRICGFTGTLGDKNDKKILSDHYALETFVIPRNKTNIRVDLPSIFCDTIKQRDEYIIQEIEAFHKRNIPVLVVFEDIQEIDNIYEILRSKRLKVHRFIGKDSRKSNPEYIAGRAGAISLGTNFCGRGTDIKCQSKALPLHIIVSYSPKNQRAMFQAFGRTSRQGKPGTTRVICSKEQIYSPRKKMSELVIKEILDEFQLINKQQKKFIQYVSDKRKWLFEKEKPRFVFEKDDIKQIRSAKINVNRITSYNFKFPMYMKVKTFLMIQSQKIFSIVNCPNSKYTGALFQKYLRELVLESWSLFINDVQWKYQAKQIEQPFYVYLRDEYTKFIQLFDTFLPPEAVTPAKIFMHLHKKVVNRYQPDIINHLKERKVMKFQKNYGGSRFFSIRFGFFPFELKDNSGARIEYSQKHEGREANYISDPELKYIYKGTSKSFSITSEIDDLFEKIASLINDKLCSLIGLRLFLRRTLSGCEFGICMDIIEKKKHIFKNIPNSLIDTGTILLFTITVKDIAPFLAGVLIIAIIFLAGAIAYIVAQIQTFGIEIVAKKLAKKALVAILNSVAGDKIGECFDRLITFLVLKIKNELADEEDLAFTFDCIIFAVVGAGVEKAGENIGNVATGILGNAFAGISKAARNVIIDELGELVPFDSIVKIVILTVLYLAAHITVRYRKRRQIANVSNKTAKLSAKYESLPKEKNAQNAKIETQSEYVDELYKKEVKTVMDSQKSKKQSKKKKH